jgi:hypothetical protein
LLNTLSEQVHAQIKSTDQPGNQNKTFNLQNELLKSEVPKITKHNKTVFFNPLLGLDNSSPSELLHDNQTDQHR